MKCPRCGNEITHVSNQLYGEIYVCENCMLVIIDFHSRIPSSIFINFQTMVFGRLLRRFSL